MDSSASNLRRLQHKDLALCFRTLKNLQQSALSSIHAKVEYDIALSLSIADFLKRKEELDLEYTQSLMKLIKSTKIGVTSGSIGKARKLSNSKSAEMLISNSGAAIYGTTSYSSDHYKTSTTTTAPTPTPTTTLDNTLIDVWMNTLNEFENFIKVKNAMISQRQSTIVDPLMAFSCKAPNRSDQCASALSEELSNSFSTLFAAKKTYSELVKQHQTAKQKYDNEISGKGPFGFLKGRSSKKLEKLRQRLDHADKLATRAKNEYIMAIENANFAQKMFYKSDISVYYRSLIEILIKNSCEVLTNYWQEEKRFLEESEKPMLNALLQITSLINVNAHVDSVFKIQTITSPPPDLEFDLLENLSKSKDSLNERQTEIESQGYKLSQDLRDKLDDLKEKLVILKDEIANADINISGCLNMASVFAVSPELGDSAVQHERMRSLIIKKKLAQNQQSLAQLLIDKISLLFPKDESPSALNRNSTFPLMYGRAVGDYTSNDPTHISFKIGDSVEIISNSRSTDGFSTGRHLESGAIGFFPSHLVAISDDEGSSLASSQTSKEILGITLFDYEAQSSTEISLPENTIVHIHADLSVFDHIEFRNLTDVATLSSAFPISSTMVLVSPFNTSGINMGNVANQGYIPASHVFPFKSPPIPAIALYSYTAQTQHQISFKEEDEIIILSKKIPNELSGEWWIGRISSHNEDKIGEFPANYVKQI